MARITDPPVEILVLIFNKLQRQPVEPVVPLYERRFLSQESVNEIIPSSGDDIRDVGRLRLGCRRLASAGASLLCNHVIARLSKRDLQRLEMLADWPHLASQVKKFSFLVPYWFKNEEELQVLRTRNGEFMDLQPLQRKEKERRRIMNSGEDVRIIEKAIRSFKSLQHVRLVRVQDENQARLQEKLHDDPELRRVVDLDWVSACFHCSRTVGKALLAADLSNIRFSFPVLSVESARFLASQRMQSVSSLAARLTSLTLQFEDVGDLDHPESQLSDHFRTIFTSAEHIQAVHIGFLSYRPQNLQLEDVFHSVKWKRLVALGLHGWDLDAEEILNLALRHREKLTGLRLRKVRLKEESMWKDVLGPLRDSMPKLEWISLTGIGYVRPLELPDGAEGLRVESLSDDEDARDGRNAINGYHSLQNFAIAGPSNPQPSIYGNGNQSDHSGSERKNSDDGDQVSADEIESLDFNVRPRRLATLSCTCSGSASSVTIDDLGDDGRAISKKRAKAWERWVVRHCPRHG